MYVCTWLLFYRTDLRGWCDADIQSHGQKNLCQTSHGPVPLYCYAGITFLVHFPALLGIDTISWLHRYDGNMAQTPKPITTTFLVFVSTQLQGTRMEAKGDLRSIMTDRTRRICGVARRRNNMRGAAGSQGPQFWSPWTLFQKAKNDRANDSVASHFCTSREVKHTHLAWRVLCSCLGWFCRPAISLNLVVINNHQPQAWARIAPALPLFPGLSRSPWTFPSSDISVHPTTWTIIITSNNRRTNKVARSASEHLH